MRAHILLLQNYDFSCFAELDPLSEKFTREDLNFPAMSAAYMLCKKYGIETPSTEFANHLKDYLANYKDTFDDVSRIL